MANLDERRIAEIVEKVLARLGGDVPGSPAEAVERAARQLPRGSGSSSSNESEKKKELRVPRGTLGVHPDVDSAVKAARRAYEQHERSSLEVRGRIVQAMRDVTMQNVRALSEYAHE